MSVRGTSSRRAAVRSGCERVRAFASDPAVWAWGVVALLALLPLREVLAGA